MREIFGDSWKSVLEKYVGKWAQDVIKAVIRQLDGIDPDEFQGELDEEAINKMVDLLARSAGEENIKDLAAEGMGEAIESLIEIAGLTDSDLDELVADAAEDMKDDEKDDSKTKSDKADNKDNGDDTKSGTDKEISDITEAKYTYSQVDIEKLEGLQSVPFEGLDAFLSEYFGFTDGVDYDKLEYWERKTREDSPEGDYMAGYKNSSSAQLGWTIEYVGGKLLKANYLYKGNAPHLFRIEFGEDGKTKSVFSRLENYEASIGFKDGYIAFANITPDKNETSTNINYKNGKLSSITLFKDTRPFDFKRYYDNGNLKSHWMVNSDGKREGTTTEYYENGNLAKSIEYVNGEMNGVFKTFYENGNIKSEDHYVNDKRHGVSKMWNEDGSLRYSDNYVNGKIQKD